MGILHSVEQFLRHVAALGHRCQTRTDILQRHQDTVGVFGAVVFGDVTVDVLDVARGILGQQNFECHGDQLF